MLDRIRMLKKKFESEGFIILGIFGSFARGEETPESDLDILFELSEQFKARYTGWDLYSRIEEIRHDIESTVGIKTDIANRDTLDRIGRYFILPEVMNVA